MSRIRCHYDDCVFLENGFCSAERIELDPETGCLTYQQADEAVAAEDVEWADTEEEGPLFDDEEEEEEVEWEEDEEDDEDEDAEEW